MIFIKARSCFITAVLCLSMIGCAQENVQAPMPPTKSVHDKVIQKYAIEIRDKVLKNVDTSAPIPKWKSASKIQIILSQTGEVLEVKIIKSTGNNKTDRLLEKAVRKSSPFAMPEDPKIAQQFTDFILVFMP